MDDKLEKELILIKLNPQYIICKSCSRYYHLQKTIDYCSSMIFSKYCSVGYCLLCDFPVSIRSLLEKLDEENYIIQLRNIEELYGNIYYIVFDPYSDSRLCTIFKKEQTGKDEQ